jgi:DNA-binding transcriptional ArsR family regulator
MEHLRSTQPAKGGSHLGVLADAAIVARRKDGNHVYYRIVDDGVLGLCEHVAGAAVMEPAVVVQLWPHRGRRVHYLPAPVFEEFVVCRLEFLDECGSFWLSEVMS